MNSKDLGADFVFAWPVGAARRDGRAAGGRDHQPPRDRGGGRPGAARATRSPRATPPSTCTRARRAADGYVDEVIAPARHARARRRRVRRARVGAAAPLAGGEHPAVTMLDGKRLLITGVLTRGSIAFEVARQAQEDGARDRADRLRPRHAADRARRARTCPTRPTCSSSTSTSPSDLARVAGRAADALGRPRRRPARDRVRAGGRARRRLPRHAGRAARSRRSRRARSR